ncbi:MAG: hemolysin family protein [Muribaculaceae bacterium]|nr:hemolysin family protein [Muribaculaceae bacterium]
MMDTLSTNSLIIVLVTMLLSAFFAGMEIAFVSANKVRIEIDTKKGGLVNRIINMFYSHSDMFISTMLVGNNVVNVVYSMAMANLIGKPINDMLGGNEFGQLVLVTIIGTIIILITGEFLPKAVFRINPNASLRMFSLPLFMCYCLLYPLSRFTEMLSQLLMRIFGIKIDKEKMHRLTVEELDAYLQETIDKREDKNEEVEREVKIFENALDFSDTHLRDCMVPRNEIVAVDINETDRDGLVEIFSKTGLSKLVVYHDDIDNVLGFISVSELFVTDVNWKDQMKPVLFAPETMLAKNMMQSLLKERRSMAIVVDEFGGTSGMVTLEDLVEEIFGDIQDEHDRNRLVARKLNESTFEFSGRMEIEEINESYHLDIPESDDYQTIAGLLLTHLGAIPNEGDTIDFKSFKVTVLKKSAARVELVRVVVTDTEE